MFGKEEQGRRTIRIWVIHRLWRLSISPFSFFIGSSDSPINNLLTTHPPLLQYFLANSLSNILHYPRCSCARYRPNSPPKMLMLSGAYVTRKHDVINFVITHSRTAMRKSHKEFASHSCRVALVEPVNLDVYMLQKMTIIIKASITPTKIKK